MEQVSASCWIHVLFAGDLEAVRAGDFVPGRGRYPVDKLPEKDVRLLRSRTDLHDEPSVIHTPTECFEDGKPPEPASAVVRDSSEVAVVAAAKASASAKAKPAVLKPEVGKPDVDKKAKYKDGSYWRTVRMHTCHMHLFTSSQDAAIL